MDFNACIKNIIYTQEIFAGLRVRVTGKKFLSQVVKMDTVPVAI